MESLFFYTLVLFLIINPFGNISLLSNLMLYTHPNRRRKVIIREMLIALTLMLVVDVIGEFVLQTLELSKETLWLGSGIILFLVSIRILFPKFGHLHLESSEKEEPFISPFAIPAVAGPSLLATILLFSNLEPNIFTTVVAIFIAWSIALAIFLFSERIHKLLGDSGLIAIEKIMGMILILLAIQRIAEGVQQFYSAN